MIPRESTWSSGRRRRDATSDRVERPRCPAQADFAASLATAKGPDLQVALEERDVVKRLRLALDLVSQERELSKLQQEISQQVETKLSSQQRTFLLNEQLKTIKKELGVETDDKDALVKNSVETNFKRPSIWGLSRSERGAVLWIRSRASLGGHVRV